MYEVVGERGESKFFITKNIKLFNGGQGIQREVERNGQND